MKRIVIKSHADRLYIRSLSVANKLHFYLSLTKEHRREYLPMLCAAGDDPNTMIGQQHHIIWC